MCIRDRKSGHLIIDSARDFDRDTEWMPFIEALAADGEVELHPEPTLLEFDSMTDSKALGLARGSSIGKRKVEDVVAWARNLLLQPGLVKHSELSSHERSAKSGVMFEGHTLIVTEDDPGMVHSLGNILKELSREAFLTHEFKFVLFNAARGDAATNYLEYPPGYTVFHKGWLRLATKKEIKFWEETYPDEVAASCATALKKTAPKASKTAKKGKK